MLGRGLLLVAALVFSGFRAGATPVHIAIDWPTGTPASSPARVHIYAVWTAGPATHGVPAGIEAEAGPDGVVLDLGEGVWQVQASAPGYWGQGAQVAATLTGADNVRLALWPAASLHGELLTAEGESPPAAVDIRLSAIPPFTEEAATPQTAIQQTPPSPSHADLHCPIVQRTWSCLGPAGLFDAQVEVSGYTPRYEWGVSLKAAESLDLGRIELRRTASVFGRAVRKNGSNPPGPCRAILQPDLERRGGPEPDPEHAPASEPSVAVPLSRSGYFQVVGAQPGRHLLAIDCQGASGIRELVVQADNETRIDPPMPLEELTLDIAVTPKVDPAGRPWRLTVDTTSPRLRRIADKAATSTDGRWIRRGLMAGSYRVAVNSSDGTLWPQQFFELNDGCLLYTSRCV